MGAPYDLSAFQNTTGNYTSYFALANDVTSGFWGFLVAIGFFLIMFISLKSFGTKKALGSAAALTSVFCVFANLANIVNDMVMYSSVVLVALVTIVIYLKRTE